jgi:hypothetical protein
MALQTSGAISLANVQTEFGGSNPISITEYYGADTGVPASGIISLDDFYGTSAYTPSYLGGVGSVFTDVGVTTLGTVKSNRPSAVLGDNPEGIEYFGAANNGSGTYWFCVYGDHADYLNGRSFFYWFSDNNYTTPEFISTSPGLGGQEWAYDVLAGWTVTQGTSTTDASDCYTALSFYQENVTFDWT